MIVAVMGPSGQRIKKTSLCEALKSPERPLTVSVLRKQQPVQCGACLERLFPAAFSKRQLSRPVHTRRCHVCIRAGHMVDSSLTSTGDSDCGVATKKAPTASTQASQTPAIIVTAMDQVDDFTGASIPKRGTVPNVDAMNATVHGKCSRTDMTQSVARALKSKPPNGTEACKQHANCTAEARPTLAQSELTLAQSELTIAQSKTSRPLRPIAETLAPVTQITATNNTVKSGDASEVLEGALDPTSVKSLEESSKEDIGQYIGKPLRTTYKGKSIKGKVVSQATTSEDGKRRWLVSFEDGYSEPCEESKLISLLDQSLDSEANKLQRQRDCIPRSQRPLSPAQKDAPDGPLLGKLELRENNIAPNASATSFEASGAAVAYQPWQEQQQYYQHWQQQHGHPHQYAQNHWQWSNNYYQQPQQHVNWHGYWQQNHGPDGRFVWSQNYVDQPRFFQPQAYTDHQVHVKSDTREECHRGNVHQKCVSGQSSSVPDKAPAAVVSVMPRQQVPDSSPLGPQQNAFASSLNTSQMSSPATDSTLVSKKRRRGDGSAPLIWTVTTQRNRRVDEVGSKRRKTRWSSLRDNKEEIRRDAELKACHEVASKAKPKAKGLEQKRQAMQTTSETAMQKSQRDQIKVQAKRAVLVEERKARKTAEASELHSGGDTDSFLNFIIHFPGRKGDIISGAKSSCS